ncbi:hypothetical protein HOD29_05785 [archaeon]|jgi:hypothetical protein|nr:hypothetical protein [archaeon]
MVEGVIEQVGLYSGISEAYTSFLGFLPFWAQNFINLFLIVLVIVVYAMFIWHFYRWIAQKNIFNLNLKKYQRSEHPFMAKAGAGIFNLLEYIVILPFLVFVWFGIFSLFLMLLTDISNLNTILVVSATVVTAIRIASYYKEDLAKDLAKLLPFTLLGIALIQSGTIGFQKLLTHLANIPAFVSQIGIYLLFIIFIELILRFLDIIFKVSGLTSLEDIEVKEGTEVKKE